MKNKYEIGTKFKMNGPYIGTVEGKENFGHDDLTGISFKIVDVFCAPNQLPEYKLDNDYWVTETRLNSSVKISD